MIFLDQTFVIGKGSGHWTDGLVDVEGAFGLPKDFIADVGNKGTGYANASYNEGTKRYTANIPLTSTGSGTDAHATLEFSPLPLGHAVNTSGEESKAVNDTGLNKHFKIIGQPGGRWATDTNLTEYLYGEFWSGSDFDRAKSAENAQYGGLQASGTSFIHGFSGTTGGRKADVYWPDYSKLSVWFNTGVKSNSLSQWTRIDVPVTTENNTRYIEFDLKPSRNAKKVTNTRGFANSTDYEDQIELPNAIPPRVRINLVDCPDSWVVSGSECLPTAVKEASGNHLAWYSFCLLYTSPSPRD